MTLIHTALLCEAQPIIEKFKLTKIKSNMYKNQNILVAISGIGKKKTNTCLQEVFANYKISKAINIGIAGCKDKSVSIGELYCTNADIKGVKRASLSTVSKPTNHINTLLVDMEADGFVSLCKSQKIEHFVLKVVSDYLDDKIPKKAYVTSLVRGCLDKWIGLI